MRRSGSYERIGSDHFFLSADDAVRHAETALEARSDIDLADSAEILVEEPRWQPK